MDPLKNYSDKENYRSFLLRLWRTEKDGQRAWRITIDEPATSMHQRFTNLSDLMAYLIEVICDIQSGKGESPSQ
jgi:hypothetical protein